MIQQTGEKGELALLRDKMLMPDEIFLIEFLKDQNRKTAEESRELYELDFNTL